jgi:hypothetical protein
MNRISEMAVPVVLRQAAARAVDAAELGRHRGLSSLAVVCVCVLCYICVSTHYTN